MQTFLVKVKNVHVQWLTSAPGEPEHVATAQELREGLQRMVYPRTIGEEVLYTKCHPPAASLLVCSCVRDITNCSIATLQMPS
jgi:hypothetical protein